MVEFILFFSLLSNLTVNNLHFLYGIIFLIVFDLPFIYFVKMILL